ncbi:M56 family metallopeptidase [Bizionia gelidisalsuginis]|uniref:M56 family metallopeptidase n=1 Tax=Bizionia gelidisalsuginis TaxID=291188 RepID=A0ABY3M8N2_9FLAO|nr:M56 family metallopeptidase [Bizionia gelidisalsuginis]TYC10597.1 M56 family metallopeptidase [Bizionia gelidisalsuginis]
MVLLLLKSTACLAIFIVFYTLVLEKETMHTFKRFYLLGALALSIAIPFITFTEYLTVETIVPALTTTGLKNAVGFQDQNTIESINYIPYILWILYGVGVLVFGLKFSVNLFKIRQRIANNPKHKTKHITNVLVEDAVTPHTFLNYIFFNKTTFENNGIPQEIKLHEETHALQKHTIDILCIELLLVFFWFNPLLYSIKRAIKLNHEFLADAGVLKRGVPALTYQNLLLAFSSGAHYNPLANAINYSLIKKRFTVMKTQTPQHAKWLKSLLMLPLLGGLLFSFSSTKTIKKESLVPVASTAQINSKTENKATSLNANQETLITINGIACDECLFNFSKKAIKNILIGTTTNDKITSFRIKFSGKPTETVKRSRTINKVAKEYLEEAMIGKMVQIFDIRAGKKVFPPVIITIVDKNDPNHTPSPKVKKGEHSILPPPAPPMPPKVKKGAVSNISPPPPPAHYKTGFLKIKGEEHYFVTLNNKTKYYNRWGIEVDDKGDEVNGSRRVSGDKVVPGQYLTKIYKNDKVVSEFKKTWRDHKMDFPEMPKLKSPEENIKEMADKNASFYFNGAPITAEKAIEIVTAQRNINMSSQTNNGVSVVHLSNTAMTIINGEMIEDKN